MKLVDKDNLEQGSPQCRAITSSGSQCSRDAVAKGFCKQHYSIRKEKGLIIDSAGDEPLQEMPEIPKDLEPMGRRHFQIYCQFLIDQDRLYEIYLYGIKELCYLEEQLQKAKEDIEKYGAINMYDSGPQVSGYATRYEKVLKGIRDLRKDYGLTAASEIVKNAPREDSGQSDNGNSKKLGSKGF